MNLLLFEFKKLIRTKTVMVLFSLTILFIIGFFVRNMMLQDMIAVKKSEYFSNFSTEVSRKNNSDQQELLTISDPEIEERLEIGRSLYTKLNELLAAIENNEWQKELSLENEVYTEAIVYQTARGSFSMNPLDMKDIMKTNDLLLLRQLAKEDQTLSIQPPIFMKYMLSLLFSPIGFIVLLLVFGTTITKEFEDRTIRLVYTLPMQKWKYVFIKFSSLSLIGLSWILCILVFSYGLPVIVTEMKEDVFAYPLLLGSGEFQEIGTFLKEAIIFSGGMVFFSFAALMLVGFLIRNTIVVYIVLLVIFVGGWVTTRNGMDRLINPFSYLDVEGTLMGQSVFFPGGMFVLIGFGAVLLLIGMWSTQKRGIN